MIYRILIVLALVPACAHKQKTPFAHLYGEKWCTGVYEKYSQSYDGVYEGALMQTKTSYALLLRQGIPALERLQSRNTPFYIRLNRQSGRFEIQRKVPERLTFTADMTEEDRKRAQVEFEEAREHIAEDYVDVRRLEYALNGLVEKLAVTRRVVSQTENEIFNLVYMREMLEQGKLPFKLPYQVTPERYDQVLGLLTARLNNDIIELHRIESGIIAVVLAARATDASSGSLCANIEAAILAVVEDEAAAPPRPSSRIPYGSVFDEQRATGDELMEKVIKDPGYAAYRKTRRNEGPDPLGSVLSIVDSVYGTSLASMSREIRNLIEGEDVDYLAMIKFASGFAPEGSAIGQVLDTAVTLTQNYRKVVSTVEKAESLAKKLKSPDPGWLVNRAEALKGRAYNQLVFFKDEAQKKLVHEKITSTDLFNMDLGSVLSSIR